METKKLNAPNAANLDATRASLALASSPPKAKQSGIATTAAGAARQLSDRQMAILEARGIDIDLAVRMGWRSSGRSASGELIGIPYFKNGKEVNCKTRSIEGEKRFYQVEGGEKCLWNVDILKDLGDYPLVITEGEMDAMIALQCGLMAVSVPDGAPKEAIGDRETVKYDYLCDIPTSVEKIILAVDSDSAGTNLLHDLAIRLGKHRCMWVQYPKGCKDLNDTFRAWGARGVDEVFARAQYMHIDGLYLMDDLPPIPMPDALDVGIPALANNLRLRRGDFSVVTGIPSHGKSTFVNHLAFNMAKNHGWNICFASFEQPPQTEHRRALRTLHASRPEHLQTPEQMAAADKFIQEKCSFIVPSDDFDDEADMTWLKDRMAAAVVRYNARLIVIDPWNEMDHQYDSRSVTMTQYVGSAIKNLKRFARKYMVHVMVVAHPAKMKKDKDGVYPIPTPYDISDSAHWYNKPEQAIIVHRPDKEKSLIRIAKSRYHNILGKPDDVEMWLNDYTGRFEKYGDKS